MRKEKEREGGEREEVDETQVRGDLKGGMRGLPTGRSRGRVRGGVSMAEGPASGSQPFPGNKTLHL